MFQLGSFEILRELSRSPHAILYAARRIGDDADATGSYAVKVFDAESIALLESVAAGQTFLERAGLQKKLAEHGTHHWATVVEMGTPDEAYFATDLYPLTAQRIVNRQANIGVRGLYTIVWSVVRGLTELRESFRRAHGNLKLTNILIGDEKLLSPKTSRVVLADPSVEAASAKDRSADLSAIGELIHQLVLRKPFMPAPTDDAPMAAPTPEYPVPMSAAWVRLGSDGKRWLDLCNWLLNPRPADRPTDLVELAVALHRMTPKVKRIRGRALVMAAIPLLVAGGALGWFWNSHTSLRADLQAAEQQWFGRLARGLDDPERETRFSQADEAIKDVAAAIRQARSQGVHFDISEDSVLQYGAYQNAKAALAVVQRVEQDLTPERSPRIAGMNDLQKRYESRGWTQPAMFLAELNRAARPAPGADVAAGLDRLLSVSDRIRPESTKLEDSWAKFEADLQTVEKTDDRALKAFAGRLREMASTALRITDAGFDGLDALQARLPLAAELARAATPERLAEIDRVRMAVEVDARLNLGNPSEQDIRAWLSSADQYTRVGLDPAAEPVAGLSASFRKLSEDMARQSLSEAELAQYQTDRSKVEEKLKELTGGRFIRKDVARGQGQIADLATDVQHGLENLRKQWVRLDDPKLWVAFIDQPLTTASEELKLRWKGYVDRQRLDVDALGKDAVRFKFVKEQAKLIREALVEIDKQFPPVLSGLGEQLAIPAWEKREQMLKAISNWADTSPGAPTPLPPELGSLSERVETQGKLFTSWCASLRELANDFPIRKELLTAADHPDEVWAAKDKAFWNDPLIQNIVKKDIERINALAKVAKLSRAELIAAIRDGKSAEIAVAAYRRLGEAAAGAPMWPVTEADLAIELDVRNRTAKLLNDIRNDAERKPVSDEWYREGPVRWRRFTNLAVLASPADAPAELERRLVTAISYRNAMHPGLSVDLEKLEPAARFNYALYEAKVSITDPSDASVRKSSTDLARAINLVKERPEVAELGKRLVHLSQAEPMSVDPKLLAPQSPESYVMTLRDGEMLKFVRIESPKLRPFYLCTTELSLGQFIELINAGGNWGTANVLLGNTSTPGGTGPVTLRGPRAWIRPPSNDGPIDRFPEWRFDSPEETEKKFAFSPEQRLYRLNKASLKPEFGDNPKLDHPMQQLPAQAALYAAAVANCRLPTAREWQAAVELERKLSASDTTPRQSPNLRDRTWRTHWDWMSKESVAQWPVASMTGVYWPKELKAPAGGAGSVVPADDHALFFRVVGDGGTGGTFHNLIGNVAEFTCDLADEFDAMPDRKSIDNVRAYCQSYANQIMVVGGSALSAPELDPLRPSPVNSPAEPYADVGVRLAFSAPARTMAERLKWTLQEQPYLAAAAVAKAGN